MFFFPAYEKNEDINRQMNEQFEKRNVMLKRLINEQTNVLIKKLSN